MGSTHVWREFKHKQPDFNFFLNKTQITHLTDLGLVHILNKLHKQYSNWGMHSPISEVLNWWWFCYPDIWQYLQTFIIVTTGEGSYYWPLMDRGQGCCQTPNNAWDSAPQQRISWPQILMVLLLRNPALEVHDFPRRYESRENFKKIYFQFIWGLFSKTYLLLMCLWLKSHSGSPFSPVLSQLPFSHFARERSIHAAFTFFSEVPEYSKAK